MLGRTTAGAPLRGHAKQPIQLVAAAIPMAVVMFGYAPARGHAQEIRISGTQAYSSLREVGFAGGFGAGARFFLAGGVGVALEFDRISSSPAVRRITCEAGSGPGTCVGELQELVDTETEADLATLILMVRGQGTQWGFRIGAGRSAGTLRASGSGRSTGRAEDLPPADDGAGAIAWERGADGTVFVVEVLRRLNVPGPVSVSLRMAFRHHSLWMRGCVVQSYSPFCGDLQLSELQAGLSVGLWPDPPEPRR